MPWSRTKALHGAVQVEGAVEGKHDSGRARCEEKPWVVRGSGFAGDVPGPQWLVVGSNQPAGDPGAVPAPEEPVGGATCTPPGGAFFGSAQSWSRAA